jgi:hypothetical protein
MKITLKQYGGLAAAVRKAPLTLDTAELGERRDEVDSLARTVWAQSGAQAAARSAPPRMPHPDEMGYTLTIAGDEGTHEVRSMESAASPELSRLVEQVRRCGKAGTV